jgi:hypothetical protein
MNSILSAAVQLLLVHGPDGQQIGFNPQTIVTMRVPRAPHHFAPGTHCLISTNDGKLLAVHETCAAILKTIQSGH